MDLSPPIARLTFALIKKCFKVYLGNAMSEEGQHLTETNRLACIMEMIYKVYQHLYGYCFENEVKTQRT